MLEIFHQSKLSSLYCCKWCLIFHKLSCHRQAYYFELVTWSMWTCIDREHKGLERRNCRDLSETTHIYCIAYANFCISWTSANNSSKKYKFVLQWVNGRFTRKHTMKIQTIKNFSSYKHIVPILVYIALSCPPSIGRSPPTKLQVNRWVARLQKVQKSRRHIRRREKENVDDAVNNSERARLEPRPTTTLRGVVFSSESVHGHQSRSSPRSARRNGR